MPKRKLKRNKMNIASLENLSAIIPTATSSPQNTSNCYNNQDELHDTIEQKFDKFEKKFRAQFAMLLAETPSIILNAPLPKVAPIDLTAVEKKGRNLHVHWNNQLAANEGNNSELDVFKTPLQKKASSAKTKVIATASKSSTKTDNNEVGPRSRTCSSFKEPYAVVTPGPMMKKSVKVLRLAQAGETAVSLNGSPLLVTPLGGVDSNKATLTIPMDNGKMMAIVQPDDLSPSTTASEVLNDLKDNAITDIKHFAVYLLKSLGSKGSDSP